MITLVSFLILSVFIILLFLFLKAEHFGKKLKLVIVLIILVGIYFSASHVLSSSNVELKSPKGIMNGLTIYTGWIGETAIKIFDIGTQSAKSVGNVVKEG